MSATAQSLSSCPAVNTPLVDKRPVRDWISIAELTLLGAIWGGSFLFMRVAAKDFGPFPLVATRLVLGAVILLPFLWSARKQLRASHWLKFFIVGALSSAIPFALFAWGAERAPAGIGAIANSMTVLFAVLVAFVAFGESIGKRRAIALIAGFVGVVVLASGKTSGESVGLAALAGTLASLSYGIAGNLVKRYLADLPPVAVASGTLTCAAVLLVPLAWWTWPSVSPPAASWASAVLLGVLCTGIAYAFYFRLIQRIGAPRASTTTYLVPLFGVLWAWVFLGEAPTVTMLIAGALILGSVILSQKRA
jgi:drug/metabolite transporter (DMT)-like permease